MSDRLVSIVPGKPMYTPTKEFRSQTIKICYQKAFGGGTHSTLSPALHFQGPRPPMIARYLAVAPLSDVMGLKTMGIFRIEQQKIVKPNLHTVVSEPLVWTNF